MDIAVIGVDGLDPDLLDEWHIDLPTLAGLLETGTAGRLRSSDPPLSAPAWSSFVTGKNGGKHGIFGFTTWDGDGYGRRPVTHDDLRAETLWEALDAAGLCCGVVNVPLTYPPPALEEGFVIAGWPVPNDAEPSSPPRIRRTIEADIGEPYEVNPFPLTIEFKQLPTDQLYDEVVSGLWHHTRAFTALLERYDPDMFVGVLMALDVASHNFAWNRDFLRDCYIEVDQAIDTLLDAIPDDTDVVLVSDHGHGAQGNRSFHVNEWLAQEGYLARRIDGSRPLLGRIGITQENYVRLKNWLGLDAPHERFPGPLYRLFADLVPRSSRSSRGFEPAAIDWPATAAFSAEQNQVFVNGPRYPGGVVDEDDIEATRTEVADALTEIPHPADDSMGPLMSAVRTRDELFAGPHVELAPDVVFVADEMRCNAPMGFTDGSVFTDERWGEHRQFGVLLTCGPSFSSEVDDQDRDITDVFPLVLSLMGVGIPEDVDGTIPIERLSTAIEPTFRESRDDATSNGTYTAAEAADVEAQLEGLGYLE